MDARSFWRIIDEYVSEDKTDAEYFYAGLSERLLEMSPDGLLGFASAMRAELNTACTWDMMGAAYLIQGSLSDEGFDAFCGWLMAQGSEVFRQAVYHPDSLADYLRNYDGGDLFEDEDILSAPMSAYEETTGSLDDYELTVDRLQQPGGEQWDIEDESDQEARLPRLHAYFNEDDDDTIVEEGEEEDY